jgi:hypothetical protein
MLCCSESMSRSMLVCEQKSGCQGLISVTHHTDQHRQSATGLPLRHRNRCKGRGHALPGRPCAWPSPGWQSASVTATRLS